MKIDNSAASFIAALNSGKICLHPTDTLPGLCFDPKNPVALKSMTSIKRDRQRKGKAYLTLVADFKKAQLNWRKLPGKWSEVLEKLWPAPLTVIWEAGANIPESLLHEGRYLAQRVPIISSEFSWFHTVLSQLNYPLPSTSVNASGEACATTYWEAEKILSGYSHCFLPDAMRSFHAASIPSTLIRLEDDGSFTCLREGAFSLNRLNQLDFKEG